MGQRFKSVFRHFSMDSQKILPFFQNPFYLTHFLPTALKKEKQFQLSVQSLKKQEVEIEYDQLNFVQDHFVFNFLTSLENRFWLYQQKPFSKKEKYSLTFQSLDFSDKSFQFSRRKQKLKNQLSFSQYSYQRLSLIESKNALIKGRILSLVRGGFLVSCLATRAFLLRSSFFFRKKRSFSYQSWFLMNISSFGYLRAFKLLNWEIKPVLFKKKLQRRFFSKKLRFYFGRRQNWQSYITLGKVF